ncbi:protein of unknown function DUF899 thioredoxin family protein [Parvibaculum lavamentivorans DS-1]|uniref:DUF899 domain-containing protein n=1 Tax=Parvibaculum lavamentivorans (strain DS-1 / DSM 13023 / NCIMB 13966) TaxID=402881 RepID=A7HS12_PARL1|nr:thioredoxin family protein [Parvibaculum lavamentivorans]ABS62695.1 protein of unknown function DUF899 thioredoxin family protein [Parvibaculum lavamentivorans DS-1]
MTAPKVASREEWLEARRALLLQEKEVTRARDRVAALRRNLPWVKLEKDYTFDGPTGKVSLSDLFGGRSQLLVQHFMLTPGSDHICPGCSLGADHVDSARMHFENADLAFAAVSRAAPEQIASIKKRMGRRFEWVSSIGNSFNYDFGVSFTPEELANGSAVYNYAPLTYQMEDLHGLSVFAKDEAGCIYHTYSTYARGSEMANATFGYLDMVSKGRNEDGIMSWVRLHDEYEGAGASCCHSA